MEPTDLPKPASDSFGLPDDFFNQQFKSILNRTTDMEAWHVPGTKAIESCFPVPDGYWLSMEDGVRARIKPGTFENQWVYSPNLKWITVAASVSIVILAGIWFQLNSMRTSNENWQAQIQQIPQEELLAYVGEAHPDEREWMESYAVRQLGENGLPELEKSENDKTFLEETLEETNYSDIIQEFDLE